MEPLPWHHISDTYLLARDPSTKVVDSVSRVGSHYRRDGDVGKVRFLLVDRVEIPLPAFFYCLVLDLTDGFQETNSL